MTEKRFTLTCNDKIIDNLTGIIHDVHNGYDVAIDLSRLLNALNDENEQLKKENQELKNYLLHMGYKTIYHDGHISLEQIEIKKMEIRNKLLDGWIE